MDGFVIFGQAKGFLNRGKRVFKKGLIDHVGIVYQVGTELAVIHCDQTTEFIVIESLENFKKKYDCVYSAQDLKEMQNFAFAFIGQKAQGKLSPRKSLLTSEELILSILKLGNVRLTANEIYNKLVK